VVPTGGGPHDLGAKLKEVVMPVEEKKNKEECASVQMSVRLESWDIYITIRYITTVRLRSRLV